MKTEHVYSFDGNGTSADVTVYRDYEPQADGTYFRHISVWLYKGNNAIYTVEYNAHELDMALALAEYYARKVNPDDIYGFLFEWLRKYPMLKLYSHKRNYSNTQQRRMGDRWKAVHYCISTPYGLKPLWRR